MMPRRAFLFLQGPSSPFFARIAAGLEARGHVTYRINLCVGDQLFWRRPGAINYRGRLAGWPAYIAGFLDRHGITDLVLLGEQRDHHKLAIAAARARGIRVAVTDFGYLRPDWIILERDGMSAHSRFPRDPATILELAATCPKAALERLYEDSFWGMALSEMAYHLTSHFLWFLFPHYRSFKVENPLLAYLGTGWRMLTGRGRTRRSAAVLAGLATDRAPYYLFPLQMENDFQIRAYSPYPDMATPIAEVIASFAGHADPACHLLVKVHPWDPGLRNWRRLVERLASAHGVAGRVHYLDGGSLYAMIRRSRGMVTVNSTSGLQALAMDAPVTVLGEAVYDVPGLTFQGSLDDFWHQAVAPDQRLRDAYLDAMAACIQVRGVFYREPGLGAAVNEAVTRLDRDCLNRPLPVAE
ncbi:MAG: capsular biosynthesis protein [Thiobacillus sp.]|nr:capsular biosynthesis protein [Thiobacillus sp.]